ncbi:CAunnamed protein product [Biomphalaria glabrata]|nr:CAunnamed protein product [Biomphalaria glabrata]
MASLAEDPATIPVYQTSTEEAIESALQDDRSLDDIAKRLDTDVVIDADRSIEVDPSDSIPRDSDTASNASSSRDAEDIFEDDYSPKSSPISRKRLPNGKDLNGSLKSDQQNTSSFNGNISGNSRKSSAGTISLGAKSTAETASLTSKKSVRKNPLQLLKKLTKFDKPKQKHAYRSEFAAVVVDKLPQVFVAKYLGHRQVGGVCGLHHVRKPVDEMVTAIRSKVEEEKSKLELPLVYVVISAKGIDVREHTSNTVKGVAPMGLIPIDFISYGVQDIKYWRVFTCIVVRELSSRSRVATCHAFLCDSAHSCRKLAVSLGAAFSIYAKQLSADGKSHNFQVELRPPDELADKLNTEFEA